VTQSAHNDFTARLSPSVAKARIIVQRQAQKARHDIGEFFSFVMRSEDTQLGMHVAPHQRLMLDFALAHDRAVLMIPADHAKTTSMAGLTLFFLGQEPTLRGAIVSATSGQAAKPLGMVRDYITDSRALRAVFADLKPSSRISDPWTGGSITIERPAGIRDPSLVAVGIDGAITGSRLKWCIVDDILNRENTATQSQRRKTLDWFDSSVLSRMVPHGGRVVVTNTAWHPEDLPHELEKAGWPTLRMDILGNIIIRNTDWDSELIRPAHKTMGEECRLVAYDPDPENVTPLWPARYGLPQIERLRREHLPYRFNQLYMNITRDDDTARCKREWIEQCKHKARERGIVQMLSNYSGEYPTFTGVDLAVQMGEENDDCSFFTFVQLPDGMRQIIDIEAGQFDGPSIVNKLFDKSERYKSIIRVENNAAQDFIRQFALAKNISLPIKPHTTGRGKAHPEHGVEGLFIELSNSAWLIPNDKFGRCHPTVQRWIDECLYYTPSSHTGDVLMSSYFAREQARKVGLQAGQVREDHHTGGGGRKPSLGATIMSR